MNINEPFFILSHFRCEMQHTMFWFETHAERADTKCKWVVSYIQRSRRGNEALRKRLARLGLDMKRRNEMTSSPALRTFTCKKVADRAQAMGAWFDDARRQLTSICLPQVVRRPELIVRIIYGEIFCFLCVTYFTLNRAILSPISPSHAHFLLLSDAAVRALHCFSRPKLSFERRQIAEKCAAAQCQSGSSMVGAGCRMYREHPAPSASNYFYALNSE